MAMAAHFDEGQLFSCNVTNCSICYPSDKGVAQTAQERPAREAQPPARAKLAKTTRMTMPKEHHSTICSLPSMRQPAATAPHSVPPHAAQGGYLQCTCLCRR